jgi:anti-sigma factor RsiW
MSQTFTCGDHEALVSYLYDECDPHERRAISAHAAVCSGCAEELTSLGATREMLGAWSPPDALLGFRVVSDAPPSTVLRPPRWWRQPMPAWAQAAAAALIFTTGVTLGALRGTSAPGAATTNPRATNVTLAAASGAAVTPAELSALEQRLRAEMSQMRNTGGPATPSAGDAQVLERVRAMIQDSEQRQQRELALRTAEVVRDFDAQRRVDLTRIERTLGQMDGTTGVEVEQQRQMLNYLMRVSQRGQ